MESFSATPALGYWIITIMGLAVGSFLNVIIFRLPLGFSMRRPARSITRCCKKKIPWFYNLPLISFIFLRGRCGFCNAKISARYPLVELLTALSFFAVYHRYGLTIDTLYFCLFLALLIAVTFIDIDHRIIPNEISYGGTVLGLMGAASVSVEAFLKSLFGLLFGAGLFWILRTLYFKIRKMEGLGLGDVKLLGMIGAFLGYKGVVITVFLSSLFGSVIGILMAYLEKKGLKAAIPFGPFLAIGAFFALFWANLFDVFVLMRGIE